MRGGLLGAAGFLALVSSCARDAPLSEPPAPAAIEENLPEPLPVYRFPAAESLSDRGTVPVRANPPPAPPADAVLQLQKEMAERNPEREHEKLRLALLLAASGDVEEADRVLSGVRDRSNRMIPWLEYFLRRERGDRRGAERLLETFLEEERRTAGLALERIERCSRVLRFREFIPAGDEPVRPGGKVLLYVEPRNFTLSREGEKYLLHLRYDWKLYDDRSVERPVPSWEKAPPEVREDRILLSGPVTEFYQSFTLPLPGDLPAGSYRILVSVQDVPGGKTATGAVSFTVSAQGR